MVLEAKRTIKNDFYSLLVWIMAIYFFGVISQFSAASAPVSDAASKGIALKIINSAESVKELVIKEDILSRNDTKEYKKEKEKSVWMMNFLVRKGAHFFNFFILGFLYCMLAFTYKNKSELSLVLISLLCGLIAAVIDETHQFFVPGRSARLYDVLIDFSGVSFGCMIFILTLKNMINKGMNSHEKVD